ncbi:MAG: CotH kinase family protein [Clostridia bacterium]|nr:CotH kinase family protein [Clostridia bacterium]MBQ9995574.1 CotH kinase family protein [Clostridia bacterium]
MSFIKENKLWCAVMAVCLIFLAVYAGWYVTHPRLTFVTGCEEEVAVQIVPRGKKTLPPLDGDIVNEGYTLEGWYTEPEFVNRYSGEELYENTTVYANWVPAVFTVKFDTELGRVTGKQVYAVEYGKVLEDAPTAKRSGLTFEGWYTEPECLNRYEPGKTKICENMTLWANFATPTEAVENLNAPVIYIDAKTSNIQRGIYTDCTVNVVSDKNSWNERNLNAQIRGRGNSTWAYYEKKPYRLKFENKVDLFGMGKAKDWILLANTVDMSMLRNFTVYKMAQQFTGLKYTTDCQFAHVYINDDYRGLFLIVEQVEAGENRVDIGDGTDALGNPAAPEDCGFLMECGNGGANDGQRVFWPKTKKSISTGSVVIKSPDADVITNDQVKYINNYMNDVVTAIADDKFDKLCELVDIQSFVDSFICTEYILAGDQGYVFFAYKEPGGKLFLGPLWDYDQSSGCSEHGGANYRGWEAASPHSWYIKLIKNEQFRALVVERWLEKYEYIHGIPEMLYETASFYQADIDANYTRWDGFLGSRQWRSLPEVDKLKTYPEHVDYFVNWLNNRVAWIEEELGINE